MPMEKNIESMEFEEALDELEKIVKALDEGRLSLKEASDLYIRGMQLKNHCTKLLETVELKLNQISPRENGTVNMVEREEVNI